jgi:DNA-3-methyladenine glycosylase
MPQRSSSRSGARPLPRRFFERDPATVARALLGKLLVRRERGRVLAGRIVETEAYLGADDAAAHAASGRTARNAVLFGPAGRAYVYFIYGNHYCLNVSCMPEGDAGCVLIRALEPLSGLRQMARARGVPVAECAALEARPLRSGRNAVRKLTSGPGRLCEALAVTRARFNGCDLTSAASPLHLAGDGFCPLRIEATPRIGIRKAAAEPLRFVIAGNAFLSGRRPGTRET